ncbi:MAG TPA: HRDC domain-containing protein [Acidothermaceae bacterium]
MSESAVSAVFLEPVMPPEESSAPAGVPPTDTAVEPETVELAPLLQVRDGVPHIIDDDETLTAAVARLAAGTGPVAVDAERASSYRYGHRAYLVQLRRVGAGILLIDPIACPDLSSVSAALGDAEWVVHAANQDLPCLADLGMYPPSLFDTELAGRIAGFPRVGLATMVENLLGWRMEKDHSAADWSSRPLPEPWLRYAALDVELLIELRDALESALDRQGKLAWAHEEFEHVRTAPPAAISVERWRRLSGIHKIRHRRQLAIVRSMWVTRDRIARETDTSPSRLLPDASILQVALETPANARELAGSADFHGRGSRRYLAQWWAAIADALAEDVDGLPEMTRPSEGPPPGHRWAERDRAAADRLAAAKAVVAALADEHGLPAENLLQPDAVRRLAWRPPSDLFAGPVGDDLRGFGAREWQIALTAGPLAHALLRAATHEGTHESAHEAGDPSIEASNEPGQTVATD